MRQIAPTAGGGPTGGAADVVASGHITGPPEAPFGCWGRHTLNFKITLGFTVLSLCVAC